MEGDVDKASLLVQGPVRLDQLLGAMLQSAGKMRWLRLLFLQKGPVSLGKNANVNGLMLVVVVVEIKYVLQFGTSVSELKINSGRLLTAACYSPMRYHTQLSQ